MKIYIYKEDMELLEKTLSDEVKRLKLMNQYRFLDYDLMNAERLLNKFQYLKRVDGYEDIYVLS